MPRIAFIIGMSRAGTTWISRALNTHPDITVFGETAFWGRNFVGRSATEPIGAKRYRRLQEALADINVDVISTLPSEERVYDLIARSLEQHCTSEDTPRQVFDHISACIAERTGAEVVIEKTPHHVRVVDRIRTCYPEARFIICYREPTEFVRSYKYQGERKPFPVKREFQQKYHPIGCALLYESYARSVIRAKSILGNQALTLPLEQVRENSAEELLRVENFLGVREGLGASDVDRNSSFSQGVDFDHLDSGEVYWVTRLCRNTASRLGYTVPPAGSLGAAIPWLLNLPVWVLRSLMLISRRSGQGLNQYLRDLLSASRA